MSSLHVFSSFSFLLLLSAAPVVAGGGRSVYVVYMGGRRPAASPESLLQRHLQLLASVTTRRKKTTLVRSYKHGFSGFAAGLSEEEAAAIRRKPGVVSVFVDPVLQLHTTRSWDFLSLQGSVKTDSRPVPPLGATSVITSTVAGGAADAIIGLLDTGIWPEAESFNDGGMGEIPARWRGKCAEAQDFNASNCNRKLIGARFYDAASRPIARLLDQSPRDFIGHGTHTASTAAGGAVTGASYYGLAAGIAKGGSTSSRLAIYKVCGSTGCAGSAILAGFDDAIADGVDVLSISLGAAASTRPDFASDPIAIGAFHAVEKGILVVCSAGNDGPAPGSVVNAAPWILTVAASTIDRDFQSEVRLGGSNSSAAVIKGEAINFSKLDKNPIYPLVYAETAMKNSSNTTSQSARNCEPYALEETKIKGKIVLCEHPPDSIPGRAKGKILEALGAAGAILVGDEEKGVASNYGSFPATTVSSKDGEAILEHIRSNKEPVATILPTVDVAKYKPAPAVPYFSSRGPSAQTANILKPDVAAPGVNILAAWPPVNETSVVPWGMKPTAFNLDTGTSMSSPHVAAIAAAVKSLNPTWSPSAIRSAIMTTATFTNNENSGLTLCSGDKATPYDCGAGEVNPAAALRPGLVYETSIRDYLLFFCNYGYSITTIRRISPSPPADRFECPPNASPASISDLNYPSIAASGGGRSRTVRRTLTYVGEEEEAAYVAAVDAPPGLNVTVTPGRLGFTRSNTTLGYEVTFSAASSNSDDDGDDEPQQSFYGSLSWTCDNSKVTSQFVFSNLKQG